MGLLLVVDSLLCFVLHWVNSVMAQPTAYTQGLRPGRVRQADTMNGEPIMVALKLKEKTRIAWVLGLGRRDVRGVALPSNQTVGDCRKRRRVQRPDHGGYRRRRPRNPHHRPARGLHERDRPAQRSANARDRLRCACTPHQNLVRLETFVSSHYIVRPGRGSAL